MNKLTFDKIDVEIIVGWSWIGDRVDLREVWPWKPPLLERLRLGLGWGHDGCHDGDQDNDGGYDGDQDDDGGYDYYDYDSHDDNEDDFDLGKWDAGRNVILIIWWQCWWS